MSGGDFLPKWTMQCQSKEVSAMFVAINFFFFFLWFCMYKCKDLALESIYLIYISDLWVHICKEVTYGRKESGLNGIGLFLQFCRC